jgi:hypothetical protein
MQEADAIRHLRETRSEIMSQWGATRSFKTGAGGYIRVIAHVAGPPFAPLQPQHIIDDLVVVHIEGDIEAATAKLVKLGDKWLGKTHREWNRA